MEFKEEFANNIYVVEFERMNIHKNDLLYSQKDCQNAFSLSIFLPFGPIIGKLKKKMHVKKKKQRIGANQMTQRIKVLVTLA